MEVQGLAFRQAVRQVGVGIPRGRLDHPHLELKTAAEALDPVPTSISRLVSIISRDHWAFSEVEQVIALDQALTGRLLQVANSAASATLMPIGTVAAALLSRM